MDDEIARNLRRTRADMLGTDDEEHYWHCHEAAAELDRLYAHIAEVEAWAARGDSLFSRQAARFALFRLGLWWADRPWRKASPDAGDSNENP